MPGSSYPSRNDEMTSMLPNRYLGSGPQPHAGPAGAATPCDRDQQDAASPPPRHATDFNQLSRAATPHTMTGPALPNGAPLGPVMYPSLASFKMRNSSVSRPR